MMGITSLIAVIFFIKIKNNLQKMMSRSKILHRTEKLPTSENDFFEKRNDNFL